jgi:hypothetical protein
MIRDVAAALAAQQHGPNPLRVAMARAIDLLTERTYGSPARSPGHNARLVLDAALKADPVSSTSGPGQFDDIAMRLWQKLCHECYNTYPAKCDCLDDIRAAFSEVLKSAPQIRTSHNSGEQLPNGDAAGCGADTSTDRTAKEPEWNDLICNLKDVINAGRAAEATSNSIACMVINELLAKRLLPPPSTDRHITAAVGYYPREWMHDDKPASSTNRDACAGGVNPGWDECQKCGATSDDPCAFASSDRPLCSCKASARDGQHMAWCHASHTDSGVARPQRVGDE